MISPRAIIRSHRIAPLPRIRAARRPELLVSWRKLEPLHALWLAVWAPWWVGNELPPPSDPRSREAEMVDPPAGSAGAWLLDALDDLTFRFGLSWTAALLLRGAWLGGVAGIAWLALSLLGVLPSPSIRGLATLAIAGMVLGLVLRIFHRPRYAAIALLLERAFNLRSRLSTAVAGLRFGEPSRGSLHALQLADAANTLERARAQLRPIHWVPVREVFIAFIVALTLLLLLVAQRPEGDIPPASRTGVPAFVPVSERLAAAQEQAPPPEMPDPATLQEVEDLSRTSNQAREDLEAIAGALEGNAVTSPAASAIASEDYPGANERLSEASGEVAQQPQGDREALADELDEAADQVSEDNPGLADAARRASDDVRSGDDTGALDELGDEIERTGESVISQQASGGELSEASADQSGQSQSGAPGGAASQPSEQPQPGETGSGETEAASQGDPGSGMDASAGVGGSEDGGETSEGGEGAQGQDQPGSSGDGSQGDASEGEPGSSGQTDTGEPSGDTAGDAGNSTSGAPNEEGDSSQGSGAGGSQRDANDPTDEGGAGGEGGDLQNEDEASESGQGEAGDPPPGGDDTEGDQGETSTAGGSASVQLPGTSGERVRSGSDVGASSVGTGGGVGAASGDSMSGVSGSTGPDSNSVPEQWRVIVESYFREGGAP